jgi:Zn-finger nucleic acid-binding protein
MAMTVPPWSQTVSRKAKPVLGRADAEVTAAVNTGTSSSLRLNRGRGIRVRAHLDPGRGTVVVVDAMTCPRCQQEMRTKSYADATVWQCSSCQGLFLEQSAIGGLVEAENDWHNHRSAHTQPMPRITADMTAPPPSAPRSRSFLETLFQS